MENCLNDDGLPLVEAPKFIPVLNESGILRLRDWAGNLMVLDAVRTLRLSIDIVFLLSLNEDEYR